jgi:hypothetical protein
MAFMIRFAPATAKKSKQILRLVRAVIKLVCINAERSKIQRSEKGPLLPIIS